MKVDFLSDLHIDFYFDPKQKIKDEKIKKLYHPIITENDREIGDVLIVSGDIGHYNHQNIKVLKYLKKYYYKYIICVLGNHDYYLFDRDSKIQFKDSFERVEQMRLRINREENMYCLNGDFVQIDGVVFGGCDSWYNDGYFLRQYPTQNFPIKSTNQQWEKIMFDAEMIIGVENYDDIWHKEKPKIESVYEQCDVMITHINPSCKDEHFSPKFQNSPSNIFFSFEGEKYLKDGSMKYWIFGHTHEELEYKEHGVHCLCNPFGYPDESKNGQSVRMQSFEIERRNLL